MMREDRLVKVHWLALLCPYETSRIIDGILLELAWIQHGILGRLLNLICRPFATLGNMTLDEKVRYGMVALSGASVVLATLGVHLNPLEIIGGMGGT
jgi:hypothetical protein